MTSQRSNPTINAKNTILMSLMLLSGSLPPNHTKTIIAIIIMIIVINNGNSFSIVHNNFLLVCIKLLKVPFLVILITALYFFLHTSLLIRKKIFFLFFIFFCILYVFYFLLQFFYFLHYLDDLIGIKSKQKLKDDKCNTRHYPKHDPNESVEQQKHQQNNRYFECRIVVNFVHLSKDIITDSHIDCCIIFERLIDKICFVGIKFLDNRGICRLFGLQRNVGSNSSDIFDFDIQNVGSICLYFFYTFFQRISKKTNDTT